MLDHLLRLLKERPAATPTVDDRRQSTGGKWSVPHAKDFPASQRLVTIVAQAGASGDRGSPAVAAIQPPVSQPNGAHGHETPHQPPANHIQPEKLRG